MGCLWLGRLPRGPHSGLVWLPHHGTPLGLRSLTYKMLTKDPFSNLKLFLQERTGGRMKWVLYWKRRGPGFPPVCYDNFWALVSYFVKLEG